MTSPSTELIMLFATIVFIVVPLLLAATLILVPNRRLVAVRGELRSRTKQALPFLSLLGLVLILNNQFREPANDLSWWLGVEITHIIVRIEGDTVVRFQEIMQAEEMMMFFSFMYVYGYVFLLVFPLIAYYLLDDLDIFKSVTIAYVVNYGLGFLLYMVFVAYGPRNIIEIGQHIYNYDSQLQILTRAINEPTNVFPSLHTSLSATVMIFAWHTRHVYRRWMPLAMFIGFSIIISTMYLALHWLTDVVVGIILAAVSYWIGIKAVENEWFPTGQLNRIGSQVDDEVR